MTCNRNRCWAALAYLATGILVLGTGAGCSRAPNPPPAPGPVSRAIRASPSELFVGDLKRLEPHLGMTTGCAHLEFGPPDRFITLVPEIWQDGKQVPSDSSATRHRQGPADASISITPVAGPGGKPQYRITTAVTGPGSMAAGTTTLDAPALGATRSSIKTLDGPVEIPEGLPVPVWAWLVYEHTNRFPSDADRKASFEEAAKGTKYAVVFKVGWEEPKDP